MRNYTLTTDNTTGYTTEQLDEINERLAPMIEAELCIDASQCGGRCGERVQGLIERELEAFDTELSRREFVDLKLFRYVINIFSLMNRGLNH